eukprot:GHVN01033045.1.p1 GENE.GHVN01033045.1~~GHVN01033045.1.p1  ORF type:complete len:537 (-),score=30.85 GHVN01033045.1:188-1798(-)
MTRDHQNTDANDINTEGSTDVTENMDGAIRMKFCVENHCSFRMLVKPSWTVENLKAQLQKRPQVPTYQWRLVYRDQVLDDSKKLEVYCLVEEEVVLIERRDTPSVTGPIASTGFPQQANLAAGETQHSVSVPQRPPLSFLGSGGPRPPSNMRPNNPTAMGGMNNAMTRFLAENPDLMRMVLESNPHFQQMRQQIPELNHILNDPQLIRQTMEMATNPNLLREVTRNNDRALSNISAMPGGFNALRRMYHSVQEPMWEAAINGNSRGPSRSGVEPDYSLGTDADPNTRPLPNPWGEPRSSASEPAGLCLPGVSSPSRSTPLLSASQQGASGPTVQSTPRFPATGLPVVPGALPQVGGIPNGHNGAPSFSWSQLLNIQEPVASQNSSYRANRQSPNTSQAPPTVAPLWHHHQGASALNGPVGSGPLPQWYVPSNANPQAPTVNPQAPPDMNPQDPASVAAALQRLSLNPNPNLGAHDPTGAPRLGPADPSWCTPEEQFRSELAQLRDMGFEDTEACIAALQACEGNIDRVINMLLGNL